MIIFSDKWELLRQGHEGFSSFSAFSAEKNRSEAEPAMTRPGAQKI